MAPSLFCISPSVLIQTTDIERPIVRQNATPTPSMQYTVQKSFLALTFSRSHRRSHASKYELSTIILANNVTLNAVAGAALTLPVVYTLLNPISVLFIQFCAFTSATFSGSSKMMSTHCFSQLPFSKHSHMLSHLSPPLSISASALPPPSLRHSNRQTHIKQARPMHRHLHHLNRRQIAPLNRQIRR